MALRTDGVTINTSSALLIQLKHGARFFSLQNLDASNEVHIRFGQEDSSATEGIRVGPAEYMEERTESLSGTAVQALSISGAVNAVITHD